MTSFLHYPFRWLCLFSLIFLMNSPVVMAQSDDPCSAPLIPDDQCLYANPVLLRNTSFQPDAPITCPGNYTRDGWFRFIAPASDITVSRSTFCRGINCTVTANPSNIHVALYQGSCGCLTIVEDCPPSCFLGIVCIESGPNFEEAAGEGDHFNGLNVGQEYYMRVLWDSINLGPPDTVIVNIVNNTPCGICPPCGLPFGPFPLSAESINLQGVSTLEGVALEWQVGSEELRRQQMHIYTQSGQNANEWEILDQGQFQVTGQDDSYRYVDENPSGDELTLYRIGVLNDNGEEFYSNTLHFKNGLQQLTAEWRSTLDEHVLQLFLPEDGEVEMYDLGGNQVFNRRVASGLRKYSWPVSHFAPGVYVLTIRTAGGTHTQKIFIRS